MIPYAQRVARTALTPVSSLAAELRALLADTLGVRAATLDGQRRFAELGLGSLLAVRFLDKVNRRFQLRLGIEALFEHSCLDELARFLDGKLAGAVPGIAAPSRAAATDIAIIGMAGRFPGADDIGAFWDRLAAGELLVRPVPADRWDTARFYDPEPGRAGKTVSKWAGLLDGIDRFDAGFFGISPREAAAMDPQHRLFLEQAWLAIEDAGYSADRVKGRRVGVFVGAGNAGYEQKLLPGTEAAQSYGMTGNLLSLLATRIAYAMDLRGPALVVDTACSSSLVAVHLACQALLAGEAEMAIAGGVRLFLDEQPFLLMSRLGMLSPDGRCRSFDAGARGIAIGEAAAAVLLKPLARALADGDRVDAVIRVSGTNQDGRSNGITAPNARAQADLLQTVLARGGIAPDTIGLIEAHGTGTPLGDPIEVAALREVFSPPHVEASCTPAHVRLGSVKSNIGHASEAAGVAGLIKAVLCLQHGEFAPSIGFDTPNPRLNLAASPFTVPTQREAWTVPAGMPRRAGVSAFGLSGTNAYAVLEEAPPAPFRPDAGPGPFLFAVSARSDAGLRARCAALAAWIRGPGQAARLDDICRTLLDGRTAWDHRAAFLVAERATALARLDALAAGDRPDGVTLGVVPRGEAPPGPATPAGFVAGAMPDGARLFPHAVRTLRLSATRFEREVHWAAMRPQIGNDMLDADAAPGETARLFRPDDALIRDHVVAGKRLLHAGIFLEMARLAAERAGHAPVSVLSDLAWLRPAEVPEAGRRFRVTVAEDGVCLLLAEGEQRPYAIVRVGAGVAAASSDRVALRTEGLRHLGGAALQAPADSPVQLGPSFPGLEELWLGADRVVARLASGPGQGSRNGVPPDLTDAAVRAAVVLLAQQDGAAMRLRYPTALARLEIMEPPPEGEAWIVGQLLPGGVVDLVLRTATGEALLAWRGLELREAAVAAEPEAAPAPRSWQVAWHEVPQPPGPARVPNLAIAAPGTTELARRLGAGRVVDATDLSALDAAVAALPVGGCVAVLGMGSDDEDLEAIVAFHRLVQRLAQSGGDQRRMTLRIVTGHAHAVTGGEPELNPSGAALEGLAKAVRAEFPAWDVTIIDVDPADVPIAAVQGETGAATGDAVAFRDGRRWVRVLEPMGKRPATPPSAGLYIVIGGMGRVGRRVCQALVGACGAQLLIIGRKPLDAERTAFLGALGTGAIYAALDVADAAALAEAFAQAEARFGAVISVIQAVVDPVIGRTDRMSAAELRAALHPKMSGLLTLGKLLKGRQIETFAVLSSIAAFAGFPGVEGQSSYVAACCFEEAEVARLRRAGLPAQIIHWGLWADPALNPAMVGWLAERGCFTLEPEAAASSFLSLLGAPACQTLHAALAPEVWECMGAPAGGVFQALVEGSRRAACGVSPGDTGLAAQVERHARALLRGIELPDRAVRPQHAALLAALHEIRARGEEGNQAGSRPAQPALAGPLALLETCVAALPDVLAGRDATDVLFPGGSATMVEAVYREQPVLAACNAAIAQGVAAAARDRAVLRVVEVGAGTGATARAVLDALAGQGVDYLYTDVSPSLLRHAQAEFAGPGRRLAVLDIERPPGAQGVAEGDADVVICSNVLHATRDIHVTLGHVARLLRPGGVAVVNEMTRVDDFATLTFGLLDGWWLSQDAERRLPGSPLLSPQGWRAALQRAGFDLVELLAPGAAAQSVLMARKAQGRAVAVAVAAIPTPQARPATGGKPSGAVGSIIRAAVAAALELPAERVECDVPFGDMGVDSIVSPQIAAAINDRLAVTLRSTDLFNFATVDALGRHIAAAFPRAVARMAEPEQPSRPPPEAAPADTVAGDAIAIIGMAGRFPDAPDVDRFWDNIVAKRSAVREVDRFDLAPWFDFERGKPGRSYAKWAALLDDHDCFDPLFFGISPAEAEAMDPQQRLLLQEAWHALEDAGLPPSQLAGESCGVFVGASASNYMAADAAPALQTLGASLAILSARLSYVLDLQGPTFPVDTGCSSSLVALHLACQSLRSGESRLAVAAGVSCNVISPHLFLYLSDAGMASPTGRCHSFDDAADGFAPGEGVGVVVLKRLSDAMAAGDRIHAVLEGSGINQDGRTSGLTAPSATSQTALERRVLATCGVDPATIGLVEAHGTGTRLGDPIEIAALTDAFGAAVPRQSCAIGSVKTNIGHAMAAAGMAGLIKAIQALRHRILPPSLNFADANRHIDFAATPFYVNTQARAWPATAHPRRAAISSFGFSGTNAHVLLREAPPAPEPSPPAPGPRLLAVSARTAAALTARLQSLAAWLDGTDAALADVADTLLRRRGAMRFRRAVVATTAGEAASLLRDAATRPAAAQPDEADSVALVAAIAGSWRAGRPAEASTLHRLAAVFEAGGEIDWAGLDDGVRRQATLPSYPFARERYWRFDASAGLPGASPAAAGAIHPLLDRNVSTRAGLRFETALPPTHPMLQDHRVGGTALLPGTAFLEMARAAATLVGEAPVTALHDVAWLAPVTAGTVWTELAPAADGLQVVLRGSDVFARGRAVFGPVARPPATDLATLRARCPRPLSGADISAGFAARGFAYGPGLLVVQSVATGDGEALGQLRAAEPAATLDGALQVAAAMGLAQAGEGGSTWVPSSLAAIAFHAELAGAAWAHARMVSSSDAALVFDVAVLDEVGRPLVSLRGLTARRLSAGAPAAELAARVYVSAWEPAAQPPTPVGPATVILLGSPELAAGWQAQAPSDRIILVEAGEAFARRADDHFVIDPAEAADHRRLFDALGADTQTELTVAQCLRLTEDASGPPATLANTLAATGLEAGLLVTAALIRAALDRPAAPTLRLLHAEPAPDGDIPPSLRAAAAFLRSLLAERTQLRARCVGVASGTSAAASLRQELADTWAGMEEVLHRQAGRTRRTRMATAIPEAAAWVRPGGTYLVTGGLGGLGLAVARHMAQAGAGRIGLLGRSGPDAAQVAALAALEADGADILTLRADVADGRALRQALQTVRRSFGPLHGIVHAAGVLRDGMALAQSPADLAAVLAPKVAGAVALDHLTAEDPLELFVLFGSTAASLGVPGQAAYAAANGFLSGFAAWRQRLVAAGRRAGRTVAVEWPLWQGGGMRPPAEIEAELERRLGLHAMPQALGLHLLGQLVALGAPDPMVLHGRTERIDSAVETPPPRAAKTDAASIVEPDAAEAYLCRVVGEVIRLAPERLEVTETFDAYGIDSMTIAKLNTRLETDLGELSRTLFFEFRCIRDLAAHLRREHGAALARHLRPTPALPPAPSAAPIAVPAQPSPAVGDAIAIIGVAGLYPGARDLEEFWANLRDGLDAITEIPPERWALEGFYDPDRSRFDTSYSKWGGFIEGAAAFDARFFGISPMEADMLDPQARKFLEICWAALEDAGVTRQTLFPGDAAAVRRGGVFVGVMSGDYQLFGPEEAARGNLIGPNAAYWGIANRVSSFLDLHGPSMAVDTACSSSLSAIHLACQSLRAGECSVALAGGTNLSLHPGKYWILSKSGFAAGDGRCRSFGAGGDGYVPGEGIGAVLLKPLAQALADGNRIHAVIRGSAINHGGRTNGYTVPNPVAQGDAIAAALHAAGTPPATIGYIEAHGTGTALGDPVEVSGLARAFAGLPVASLAIGSVKSNIGHLEAAAGIAGVTKVLAQFQAGMLAPSLHADTLNPGLGLERTPLLVQRMAASWPRPAGGRRRAGVSSFGAGGSNAHLVLEEAPEMAADPDMAGPFVVPLSAMTADALRARASTLAAWMRRHPAMPLAGLVRTLQAGREAMRLRAAAVVADRDALLVALDGWASGAGPVADVKRGTGPVDAGMAPEAVAAAWIAGGAVDWDRVAPGKRPPVTLPTYPFEARHCWFRRPAPPRPGFALAAQADGSTLVAIDREAPFVLDHRVAGRTILPGALLLDIALAASGRALPLAITDIRFVRPVDGAETGTLHAAAWPRLSLRSDPELVHLEGAFEPARHPSAAPDLTAILARCPDRIEAEAIYTLLGRAGVVYGPAYRILAWIARGQGEAVAGLHPAPSWAAVLDAALQTTFAVLPDDAGANGYLPAALERLTLYGAPAQAMQVHTVRRAGNAGSVRLDLTVLDASGTILATADGFTAKAPAIASALPPLRIYVPRLQETGTVSVSPGLPRRAFVVATENDRLGAALAVAMAAQSAPSLPPQLEPGIEEVWLVVGGTAGHGAASTAPVLALYRSLRALTDTALRVVVLTTSAHRVGEREVASPAAAAAAAFTRSVGREWPAERLRVIDIGAADRDDPTLPQRLLTLADAEHIDPVLRGDTVFRKRFETLSLPAAEASPWRRGCTVVIAGGTGGLGRALAEHLAATTAARVVLLGRGETSAAVHDTIAACARSGGEAVHLCADIADPGSLGRALDETVARFGPIEVAVHAAMVMHDATLARLEEADLGRVLAPKTVGLTNLVAALAAREPAAAPARLVLFSSANAHTANPGQSAYAAASAFEDSFALSLQGRPVTVIDWGLWGEAGHVATGPQLAAMARIGVHPIATREGLAVTDRLVAACVRQAMPMRISPAVASQLGVITAPPGPGGTDTPIAAAASAAACIGTAAIDGAAARFEALNRHGAACLHDALRSGQAVAPAQRRLHAALLDMLARHGKVLGAAMADAPALEQARSDLLAESSEAAPYLALLAATTAALPDVLAGRVDANDVLFPGGSTALVAPIYAGNAVVDHFQSVLAAGVAAAVAARLPSLPQGDTLRILEVGAGTGGTTRFVLDAVAHHADRIEYVFTDIGDGFLAAARQDFVGLYPFVTVRRLDIDLPPAGQGFAPGSFDVVIAANVLHATGRIHASIGAVKALCRAGGVLAINEATAVQDYNTLTFGLTRGWWAFEDDALRLPHAPLLDVPRWRAVLGQAGWRDIAVFGDPALQCVILAASDGVIPADGAASRRAVPPRTEAGDASELEERLRRTVAAALRLAPEEVEPDVSFAEYGADSIISVELVRHINQAFGIELKTTTLFNYATVRELATFMRLEHGVCGGEKMEEARAAEVSDRLHASRERTGKLRRMLRERLDGTPVNRPDERTGPAEAPAAPSDGDDLLGVLLRLERGELDYDDAIRRTLHDA